MYVFTEGIVKPPEKLRNTLTKQSQKCYQSEAACGNGYLDEQVICQLVKRDVWNYQQQKENKTVK